MTSEAKTRQRRIAIEKSLQGFPFPKFEKLQLLGHPDYDKEYTYALNYANYTYDHDQLKKFTQEYFGSHNLSKIPNWEFMHLGIMCWLATKKVPLMPEQINAMNAKVERLYEKYNVAEKVPTDFRAIRTSDLIAELEGILDDIVLKKTIVQPAKLIEDAGGVDIEKIKAHFQAQLDEVSNSDNAEYFPDAKRLKVGLTVILADLDKQKSKKPVRKTRTMKPRKINPTKMVRRLKYLKSDKDTNLTSIDPEKIIGATVLWVFNVKTRKLGQYVAKDDTQLMIKGSTVLNFEPNCIHKKVRKPAEILPKLMSAGKVEQRKLLEGIKAVASPLTGRINKDTILVRVF